MWAGGKLLLVAWGMVSEKRFQQRGFAVLCARCSVRCRGAGGVRGAKHSRVLILSCLPRLGKLGLTRPG